MLYDGVVLYSNVPSMINCVLSWSDMTTFELEGSFRA